MDLDWRSTFLLLTGVPALLAAGMAMLRSPERLAARLFFALIAAWVLMTMPYIIGFSGAYDAYPGLTFAPFNTELWIGPLWWLHIRALTGPGLPRRWWLWLAPGLVQTTYYTVCFFALGPWQAKFAFNDAVHEPYIMVVETFVGLALITYAAIAGAQASRRYHGWIDREHANRERIDLVWLQRGGVIIAGIAAVWVINDLVQLATGRFPYSIDFYVYAGVGVVALYMALDALSRADRRLPKMPAAGQAGLEAAHPEAVEPSVDLEALKHRVHQGGWYADPDLTLEQLSRHLAVNKRTLSRWLNSSDGGGFSHFINGLRVEAVCAALHENGLSSNLLMLALDCGFGSKATFNRAFKAHTGMTPRAWIASHRGPSGVQEAV
ncbi:MAG: helix-turn-helix transcriptional regulator [Pseudomonadota bacterium]